MTFIRWILFLPAGVIAGGLVQFLYPTLTAGRYEENDILSFFAALLAGAVTVYVSAKVSGWEL